MPVREPLHVGYWAGAWEDRVDLSVCSCYPFQRDHSLIRWPPRVPQAPTTQGVEPDFFFWRAAGARRCSRAGRLREGKRPGQRSSYRVDPNVNRDLLFEGPLMAWLS